jgi:nitrogen fixation/metabolism regulation signal transduction histidine kinase
MFKTIERKLIVLSLLLVAATATAVWLLTSGYPVWSIVAAITVIWLFSGLLRGYKKYNSNIIFLLNALENGDYSFNFAEGTTTVSNEKRDVYSILNAIKDMLARAKEEEIENEKFLSLIVAAIPTGIVIVDERDFVRVANDAAIRLLGMRVFTHVKQLAMVDEGVLQTFRELTPGHRTTIRIADEREERLISLGMSRIRINRGELRVVSMYNIAGELEEREMESWIKLIRVMTHEIMNSIAPITSLSETMFLGWKEGEEDERLRRNTVEAFETITSTARGLLSFVESYRRFTGIPRPALRPVELVPFVRRITGLEASLFDERGVTIAVHTDAPAITVDADEGQIGQVLVNLLRNAAEAIEPDRRDGKIEVRVWSDGESTHLDVANNGTPIPAEVLPNIFIPFFTTKESGTGIGLSVSRYIMRLHGGNLKHHASDGLTVFSMAFPKSQQTTD